MLLNLDPLIILRILGLAAVDSIELKMLDELIPGVSLFILDFTSRGVIRFAFVSYRFGGQM